MPRLLTFWHCVLFVFLCLFLFLLLCFNLLSSKFVLLPAETNKFTSIRVLLTSCGRRNQLREKSPTTHVCTHALCTLHYIFLFLWMTVIFYMLLYEAVTVNRAYQYKISVQVVLQQEPLTSFSIFSTVACGAQCFLNSFFFNQRHNSIWFDVSDSLLIIISAAFGLDSFIFFLLYLVLPLSRRTLASN